MPDATSNTTATGNSNAIPKAMTNVMVKPSQAPISVITATPSGATEIKKANNNGMTTNQANRAPR